MAAIELVIFDCDGVLIDSEVISKQVLMLELKEFGIVIDDDYFVEHCLGRSFQHVEQRLYADFNRPLPEDFETHYRELLLQKFSTQLTQTPDVTWMLDNLTPRFCLATSSSRPRTTRALRITGLDQYFDENVFTTSEVSRGKPAPDLFLYAADKMAVSPENCIVIEDSLSGVQAAISAGMRVYRYLGASHLRDVHTNIADQGYTAFKHWRDLCKLVPSIISTK